MRRKFLTNLVLLLSLNILVKGFWILGIDRTVQNTVGAGSYGFYFAILNFSFLLNILLDAGITNFNNRNIAQNWHLLGKHFRGIVTMKLMLGIVYMAVSFILALVLGYRGMALKMLAWLALNQFILSFTLYLRSNITGLHMFRTDSLISVLDRFLMIVFCGALLWGGFTGGRFLIQWFVYCQTAAYSVTALTALVIVWRRAAFRSLSWNPAFFLLIMRKSWPFAILVLLMTFYNRIDSVMLERILPAGTGDRQAGIYASAYRLLDAVNMIAYLFAVLLLPIFSRMIKLKQDVDELVRLAYSLLFVVSVTVAIMSFRYARPLMALMYVDHVADSARIFGPLMAGFIAISTTYVFGTLLTANNNLRLLNTVAATAMLINIILNLVLIPRYMAMGSVIASLVTQYIMASVQVIGSWRIFRMKPDLRFLLRLLGFVLLMLAISAVLPSLHLDWTYGLMAMALAALVFAFLLSLIKPREILSILRDG